MKIEGKVAVVTGGSRGIGRAAALRLAHEGADVALVARDVDGNRLGRSQAETVAEVQAVGVRAVAIAADLTRRQGTVQQPTAHDEAHDPADVVVDLRRADFAGTDRSIQIFAEESGWAWHFEVEAGIGRRHRRSCRAPVRHDEALVIPFRL